MHKYVSEKKGKVKDKVRRLFDTSFPSPPSLTPPADAHRNLLVSIAGRIQPASLPDLPSSTLVPIQNVPERCASAPGHSPLPSVTTAEAALPARDQDQQQSTSPSLSTSPWARAVEKLKLEIRNEFNFDHPDKLNTLEEVLEATKVRQRECIEKQWKYQKHNGEEIILRHIADSILTNLNKFMTIGDTAMQISPQPVAVIWSAFRFLLQVAANDMETMEKVMSELEYVSRILGRCATYENLYNKSELKSAQNMMDSLPDLYAAILTYLWHSKRYFSRDTSVRYVNSFTNSYTAEFQPIMDRLKKLEQSVENAARTAADEAQAQAVKRAEKAVKRTEEKSSDEERSEILRWLSGVTYKRHHEFIKSNRQPGTGNWLLAKKEFVEWEKSESSSILWLHGIAGAGKTTLASFVIDQIESNKSEDHALAYFYCKYGEKDRQDPESILRTIIKQLSIAYPEDSLPEPVVSNYRKHKREGFTSGSLRLVESKELISQVAGDFEQTIIIIDALDECDRATRKNLLAALQGICQSTPRLKVFVTSRDDDDIVLKLDDVPNIYIRSRDNSSDIELYVVEEVERCIAEKELLRGSVTPELKQIVVDTLTEKANGMFLWVFLQIKHISLEKTETGVKEALKRLPEDLEATYTLIWDRICRDTKQNCYLAKQTLKWIMCTARPLTPGELLDAISVTPMRWMEYPDHGGITEMTLLAVCQNLLVIDKELGVFRSAHFSVTEFLQKKFDKSEAHAVVAKVCLTLLCSENHIQTENGIWNNYSLGEYVMENWAEHVRLSGDGSDILMELQKMFFRPSAAYHKWLQVASKDKGVFLSPPGERKLTPLWVICYYGLCGIFEYFLRSNNDCSVQNTYRPAPLHAKVMDRHEAVYAMLLGKEGFDFSFKNSRDRTPLHAAAMMGHEVIVSALLEKKGVDLNCEDQNGETPLYNATMKGHEAVVRLLLGKEGVNLNCKNDDGRTPLYIAAFNGHEAVVRLLLEKEGVDLNCKNKLESRTPLNGAAYKGHEAVVRLLLEKEYVDLNCKNEYDETPLSVAAYEGHEAVVRLLLEKDGVDLNCKNDYGETPLNVAARKGHETVVRLLLEKKGVDLNNEDRHGRTALDIAAQMGHEAVVRLLLERGSHPGSRGSRGSRVEERIAFI